jgi:UV DNA damage endonuclease
MSPPRQRRRETTPDIRLGLCCIFLDEPVRFRATTATALLRLDPKARLAKVSALCHDNALNLVAAMRASERLGIRAFRILSPVFPCITHPAAGYAMESLHGWEAIAALLEEAGSLARKAGIRLSFHPDQFVLLNSPRPDVLGKSLADLAYHTRLAGLVGAESVNLHGGGAYGDKPSALDRLRRSVDALPDATRALLTLENDDVTFTVADLLPVCRETGVPLVYDVHHHRCNPDGLGVAEATGLCTETWRAAGREPHFHLSSPKHGWESANPRPHADYIDPADFPECWLTAGPLTVDIEAKAKERAVLRLRRDLENRKP